MLVCFCTLLPFLGFSLIYVSSAASYGVVIEPSEVDSWMCEICQNEDTLESSIVCAILVPDPKLAYLLSLVPYMRFMPELRKKFETRD